MIRRITLAAAFFMLLGLPSLTWAVATPIYSILGDDGSVGDDIYTWNGVALSSSSTAVPAPEGQYTMQMIAPPGAGWGVVNLESDKSTPRAVDLSAYAASGEIRFWAYCTTDKFLLDIEHVDHAKEEFDFTGAFGGDFNQWVSVVVPLNLTGSPLNDIFSPFEITMKGAPATGGTCYVDNIRYVNPPSDSAPIFSAAIKNIADQSPATQFSWSAVTLPTGWARADQYIDLELDDPDDLAWGVQIYTDNTHSSNPSTKFASAVPSGQAGSNPSGLVDTQQTSHVLPLAWSIKAGTHTPVDVEPTAAEPNNNGVGSNPTDNNAFQWLYMQDLATPNIAATGTTAFANGSTPVVVKNNLGIHFGQSNAEIGAAHPPNYIYLEANFGTAATPRTFQTDALIVEFFHE